MEMVSSASSSSSFSTIYSHRPCTLANRRVRRRMEPSHLAKKELQKMKEQEQKLQLQMDYSLPVHFVNINVVIPHQLPVPPQQPGFDPQQGFPPHQPGFLSHQQGFTPQMQAYDPQLQAFVPIPPGYVPYQQGFLPHHDGFVPQDPGFVPSQQPANVYNRPATQPNGQQTNGEQQGGRTRRRLPDLPPGVPVLPYLPRRREHRPDVPMNPPVNPPVASTTSTQENEPEEPPELSSIGLYTLHEKLGDGMYGAVRRATHKVTKDQVAIKSIDKSKLVPLKGSLCRVYREVEVQKKMSHPFVLDVYQVMETETHLYLVTELCQGGELFNLIRANGRLPEPQARQYFAQLVSAVQYMHQRGIVHRDIKAENLLLDEFGNLKVADFGFANFVGRDFLMQTYCGSPQYAAPEIFEEHRYNGPAVDIWCMGVCLYVFLVGTTPFEGKNFDEMKRKVISHKIECPYFVSPEATHLLSRMLNRTVNERATLSEVANHVWLKHDGLPLYIMNSLLTYNFFLESTPRDLMKECLTEVGITEQQLKERMDRYDNVDGMHRLLLKDHRMRRLRKVWVDRKTTEIFVAAHILKSQGECMAVVPVVTKIAAAPIKEILQARAQEIDEAEENNATWSLYLPHPEEYPYHEFKEEQRKEAEENERMALESEQGSSTQFIPADYTSVRTMEAAVGSSQASGRVQQPLTVAAHLQPPVVARSTEIADFIAAQNGSAMEASGNWEPSALLALAASLNEVPLELRRLPSDVCHRIAALDLIQKRRGGVPGQGPPLPKRQSLPSLFEQSILRRTTVRLGDPPKKNQRKNFFEMIRLKRRQADKQNGQSTSGTNWSLPPPALPEGGSFDDADEGKPAPHN